MAKRIPDSEWLSDWEKIKSGVSSGDIDPPTLREGARHIGINYKGLHNALSRIIPDFSANMLADVYTGRKNKQGGKFKETFQMNEDGEIYSDKLIELFEEDLTDERRLLEAHGLDPDIWEIIKIKNQMWHGQRGADLGGGVQILYNSRLDARPTTGRLTIEVIDEFFADYEPPNFSTVTTPKVDASGFLLEIDLADLHKGKKAAYGESDITDNFCLTINDIVNKAKSINISKIYLVNLGDLFHYDTKAQTTSAGTYVATDGLSPKEAFDAAEYLFIWAIEQLAKIAPVEFIHIGGNHDYLLSYTFAKGLSNYFRNVSTIKIDTEHKQRKFRLLGCTLIGWGHGDIAKARASDWLQVEARDLWSSAKYFEIHYGHFHSKSSLEKGGVHVQYLPSMTPTDQWHYDKGYVGAVKSTVCFLWDINRGLWEKWYFNVV